MAGDDEMPHMSSRDDPMDSHIEYAGPFQRTYVLCNGFRVPHLTVSDADSGDEVMLVLRDSLAYPVPKSHADTVVALVANAIAIERGYGCFPRSPDDQRMQSAPPFGAIWHEVGIGTEQGSET